MNTVCSLCGAFKVRGSRCPTCGGGQSRHVDKSAWASRAWKALSQRRRAEHVARFGWVCPGFGRPAHPSRDLVLDHPVSVAQGGAPLPTDGKVMCRGCNTRKMHADRPDVKYRAAAASVARARVPGTWQGNAAWESAERRAAREAGRQVEQEEAMFAKVEREAEAEADAALADEQRLAGLVRACETCGTTFVALTAAGRYCSIQCSGVAKRRVIGQGSKQCARCGAAFDAVSPLATYCSRRCSKAAEHQRAAARARAYPLVNSLHA